MVKNEKRDSRIASLYTTLAAEFLERDPAPHGLLTVTGIDISKDKKNVAILFTVFPDRYQSEALRFAKKARSDFREYVKSKTKHMAFCPTFDFAIDIGEKHRQKIESLFKADISKK